MAGKKPLKFRAFLFTDAFDKDLDKVIRSNVHDLTLLNAFMAALVAHSADLVPVWKDHALKPDKKKGLEDGDRDAHLKGDLVVIYRIDDHPRRADSEVVSLLRIGKHAVVLGM